MRFKEGTHRVPFFHSVTRSATATASILERFFLMWNHSDGAIFRQGQVLFRRPYQETGKEQCAGFAGKTPVPKGLPRGGLYKTEEILAKLGFHGHSPRGWVTNS